MLYNLESIPGVITYNCQEARIFQSIPSGGLLKHIRMKKLESISVNCYQQPIILPTGAN